MRAELKYWAIIRRILLRFVLQDSRGFLWQSGNKTEPTKGRGMLLITWAMSDPAVCKNWTAVNSGFSQSKDVAER